MIGTGEVRLPPTLSRLTRLRPRGQKPASLAARPPPSRDRRGENESLAGSSGPVTARAGRPGCYVTPAVRFCRLTRRRPGCGRSFSSSQKWTDAASGRCAEAIARPVDERALPGGPSRAIVASKLQHAAIQSSFSQILHASHLSVRCARSRSDSTTGCDPEADASGSRGGPSRGRRRGFMRVSRLRDGANGIGGSFGRSGKDEKR